MDGKDKMEWCNTADDATLSIETLGQEMEWPPSIYLLWTRYPRQEIYSAKKPMICLWGGNIAFQVFGGGVEIYCKAFQVFGVEI